MVFGVFFEAFNNHNFKVNLNDSAKEAQFILKNPFEKSPRFLECVLNYNQILEGWRNHPKGCAQSYHDSICMIYDEMGPDWRNTSREDVQKRNQWAEYRGSEYRKVRQKMEDIWLPFFIEHQEHLFFPVNGKSPELEKPKIFFEVLKKFPMHILRNASIENLFPDEGHYRVGPCPERLLELDLDNDLEIGEYYPSKSTMIEFFWGNYLNKLSEEKGYPLRHNSDNKLRYLIIGGIESFERGDSLKWKV